MRAQRNCRISEGMARGGTAMRRSILRVGACAATLLAVTSFGVTSSGADDEAPPCSVPAPPGTITGSGVINGTAGDDIIYGSPGADTINGLGGNDLICGLGGADTIDGGTGD